MGGAACSAKIETMAFVGTGSPANTGARAVLLLQHLPQVPARGDLEAIWAELHMALRERMGREASPSAAVLDSQSVKSAEKGAVETTKSVTTPASRSRAVNFTRWSTAKGCRCGSSSIRRRSRTAPAPVSSSTRYADGSRGSN